MPDPLESSDSIRLPELSIFRKYSLALRQEFSGAQEVLAALRETYAEVEKATGAVSEPLQKRSPPGRRPGQAGRAGDEQVPGPSPGPGQRGKTFRLDSLGELDPGPAAAPPAPQPAPAAQGPSAIAAEAPRRVFEDDDPRSYLKRLAAARPLEFPDDDFAEGESSADSAVDKPSPAFPAGEEDGPRATSPTDEESFWNRARRRRKKDDL